MSQLASTVAGCQIIYPSILFNAEATLQAVHDFKATVLQGVPTMFIEELHHPKFKEFDLSHLRTGIMAGANCSNELLQQ